ncbi:hypothetical protein EDD16DRAFT_1528332 [Pisolithus croceorrhizus]|nr:hypothetical protein EDD16DRAFT_1528332 [Pisolithus croceorrhizus]
MSTGRTGVGSSLKISVTAWVVVSGCASDRGNRGCGAHSNTSTNAGRRGHKSEHGSRVDSNMSMNMGRQGRKSKHGSGREVNHKMIQMVLESAPGYFSWYLLPPKYSLHEPQFAQIWPFQPQKKQNEYVWWGHLRGTEGSSKLQKVHNLGNSGRA